METKNVNIQAIIKEIRDKIKKLPIENIPVLDDVPFRTEEEPLSFQVEYNYINQHWNIPYYRDLGTSKPKLLLKRIIRKLMRFVVFPMREDQNIFNANAVHVINCLLILSNRQRKQNEKLQKQITQMQKRINALEQNFMKERKCS